MDLVDGVLSGEAMGWMVVAERKCLAWLLWQHIQCLTLLSAT